MTVMRGRKNAVYPSLPDTFCTNGKMDSFFPIHVPVCVRVARVGPAGTVAVAADVGGGQAEAVRVGDGVHGADARVADLEI